jgi:hypothetical protein
MKAKLELELKFGPQTEIWRPTLPAGLNMGFSAIISSITPCCSSVSALRMRLARVLVRFPLLSNLGSGEGVLFGSCDLYVCVHVSVCLVLDESNLDMNLIIYYHDR